MDIVPSMVATLSAAAVFFTPDDRHAGRRLPLDGERLELSQFPGCEVDRREEARAAAVSEERLPRVAHGGPAGDGDLRAAGGET